jgi:hypothetical protein
MRLRFWPPFRKKPLVTDPISGFLVHVDEVEDDGRGSWVHPDNRDERGYRERLQSQARVHPLLKTPRKNPTQRDRW